MMQSSESQLVALLREPKAGAVAVGGRVGVVSSTLPPTANLEGVEIVCRQIAGQQLKVGQPCVILSLDIGTKPLLIQTS
jgi:hypothetical protein